MSEGRNLRAGGSWKPRIMDGGWSCCAGALRLMPGVLHLKDLGVTCAVVSVLVRAR